MKKTIFVCDACKKEKDVWQLRFPGLGMERKEIDVCGECMREEIQKGIIGLPPEDADKYMMRLTQ